MRDENGKKINPSKSRQGRAARVNGALRNPHWERQRYVPGTGRNPATRKHPRLYTPENIEAIKYEARTALECHADYENEIRENYEVDSRGEQHLAALRLRAGRISRNLECAVSRDLDVRWTVGTVSGQEVFTNKGV